MAHRWTRYQPQDSSDTEDFCEVDDEGQTVMAREVGQARRRFLTEEYAVKMEFVDAILAQFKIPKENLHELFADDKNHRMETYWTAKDNSFTKNWSNFQVWCNPPFSLMDRVVLKLLGDEVKLGICIAPVWTTAPWWRVLQDLTENYIDYPMGTTFFEFFDAGKDKMVDAGPLRWKVRACLVKYDHYLWLKYDQYIWDREVEEREVKMVTKAKARRERRARQRREQGWWN